MISAGRLSATPWGPIAYEKSNGPIARSYWVIEDRLAGGPYPFHSNLATGMAILEKVQLSGIDTFVNLTRDADSHSSDAHLVSYGRYINDGVRSRSHPITDLDIPTTDEMIDTLDTIDRDLGEGRSLYVHCWGGVGRTGTVLGCWLIRHKVAPPDEAIDVLARLRPQDRVAGRRRSPETPPQVAFVAAWQPGR